MARLQLRNDGQIVNGVPDVRDIDGVSLQENDIVEVTEARVKAYDFGKYGAQVGERLRIVRIYHYVLTNEWVGELHYLDGSGSIWNSTLELYRKVEP